MLVLNENSPNASTDDVTVDKSVGLLPFYAYEFSDPATGAAFYVGRSMGVPTEIPALLGCTRRAKIVPFFLSVAWVPRSALAKPLSSASRQT